MDRVVVTALPRAVPTVSTTLPRAGGDPRAAAFLAHAEAVLRGPADQDQLWRLLGDLRAAIAVARAAVAAPASPDRRRTAAAATAAWELTRLRRLDRIARSKLLPPSQRPVLPR